MLSLETRINLLERLGAYMASDNEEWIYTKERAVSANPWFNITDVNLAVDNIIAHYLQKDKLQNWMAGYTLPAQPKKVGIVMAGNIPLVGFHDFLCGFISGHILYLKLSSKDSILLNHLIAQLANWQPEVSEQIYIAEMLKSCDAYIATGSNNTARYFEQYFGKYPHIIRKNRTSVAVLDGTETTGELESLADDVFSYYGLGCRNITQVYVPEHYNFEILLNAFAKYSTLTNHHKYQNNYDYHLAIYLLNKVAYITNGSVLLVENSMPFSAVSVLHYQHYSDIDTLLASLKNNTDIQSIEGKGGIPFGYSQSPALNDYADGVDTMAFLCGL